MSPHHAVSSSWDSGEKARLIRSGESEVASGSGVVVTLKRRLQRPIRPRRTMRRATRFCPTQMPASASSVVIRGAP
jgi:hypothetical protein